MTARMLIVIVLAYAVAISAISAHLPAGAGPASEAALARVAG
ncbi:hypothetical protein [Bosea sp. 117]|nr:hypothetical protein [Bosea sp. 117]